MCDECLKEIYEHLLPEACQVFTVLGKDPDR